MRLGAVAPAPEAQFRSTGGGAAGLAPALAAASAVAPQDVQKAALSFIFAPHFGQNAIVISSCLKAGQPLALYAKR